MARFEFDDKMLDLINDTLIGIDVRLRLVESTNKKYEIEYFLLYMRGRELGSVHLGKINKNGCYVYPKKFDKTELTLFDCSAVKSFLEILHILVKGFEK